MDVAALPINLTPQSPAASNNVAGELPVDAAQLGIALGADWFAALLAKQIGADVKGAPALGVPVEADAPVGSDPAAPAVDAALQLQQAALFMPVPVNVPDAIKVMPKVEAQTEVSVGSLPGRAAGDIQGESLRQPVAANPAAFAVSGKGGEVALDRAFPLKTAQAEVPQVTTLPLSVPSPVVLPIQMPTLQDNAVQ